MDVSIHISSTDNLRQRNTAYQVLALVYGTGVQRDKIEPEDNPAVGGGVPPAPLAQEQQTATSFVPAQGNGSVASGSTDGTTLLQSPGLPASVTSPVASGPANTAGGMPTLDKEGLPWDGRIHSDSKNFNADGTWRKRRNLEKSGVNVAAIEAELRAIVGTTHMQSGQLTDQQRGLVAPANQYQVAGVSAETAAAVQAGHPITVSPAEAAAVIAASQASMQHAPAIPTPPAAAVPVPAGLPAHIALMQKIGPLIITEANPGGFITALDVKAVCKSLDIVDAAGDGNVMKLGENLDAIDDFRQAINDLVAGAAAMQGKVAPVLQ